MGGSFLPRHEERRGKEYGEGEFTTETQRAQGNGMETGMGGELIEGA